MPVAKPHGLHIITNSGLKSLDFGLSIRPSAHLSVYSKTRQYRQCGTLLQYRTCRKQEGSRLEGFVKHKMTLWLHVASEVWFTVIIPAHVKLCFANLIRAEKSKSKIDRHTVQLESFSPPHAALFPDSTWTRPCRHRGWYLPAAPLWTCLVHLQWSV